MTERTVTLGGNPAPLSGQPVAVGAKAPEFTAVKADMSPYALSGSKGKVVVINSVPSFDTPVCATQARTFNKQATGLGGNVEIVFVSMDLPFALKRFCAAEGIDNVVTVSDHRAAEFGEKYGVLLAGPRLLARSVTVVDPGGVVRYHELVQVTSQEPNYDAALAAVKKIVG